MKFFGTKSMMCIGLLVLIIVSIGYTQVNIDPVDDNTPKSIRNVSKMKYDESDWLRLYIQAWEENLQHGISRINIDPQKIGVTPINGALLLNQTEFTLPARNGNLSITRIYNSKIWLHDSIYSDSTEGMDILKAYTWLGMGWDLHFGRRYRRFYNDYQGFVFEMPNGTMTYYQRRNDNSYVATDGSYAVYKNDTIKMGNGTMIIFNANPTKIIQWWNGMNKEYDRNIYEIKKLIDQNGNITSFFYNNSALYFGVQATLPNGGTFYGLDSIKTSANQKATFYYRADTIGPNDEYTYILLDSIKYKGFNNIDLKISYHYRYDSTNTSIFGNNFVSEVGYPDTYWNWYVNWGHPTFLLKSTVYPNGESIYYNYNQYYELTGVHNAQGGLTNCGYKADSFEYVTDSFWIPNVIMYPNGLTECYPLKNLTRGISKTKSSDSWSETDSMLFNRVFRVLWDENPSRAVSNADSVTIVDALNDSNIYIYHASWQKYISGWGLVTWQYDNGKLDNQRTVDKNGILTKRLSYDTKLITDNIPVIEWQKSYNGLKSYITKFHDYDDYGNARLIHEMGDSSITSDDRWIHRTFHYLSSPTCSLKLSFYGMTPYYNAKVDYTSPTGFDSLIFVRHWWGGAEKRDSTNKIFYNPVHYKGYETFRLKPIPFENDTMAVCSCWAYYGNKVLRVWSDIMNLRPDEPVGSGGEGAQLLQTDQTDYSYKYLVHLVTEEWITADSVGDSLLCKSRYFYDDTACIVKSYPADSIKQWSSPPFQSTIRGNLTRIERNKVGSTYTNSELRYDSLGNVVMAINYLNDYNAETTFTHYAGTFNYAFPYRIVNHLPSSSCSLTTRNQYDVYTGLLVKTFDANEDSTIYNYDTLNRLIKLWQPNEENPSKIVHYCKYTVDAGTFRAVLDSVKLDTCWLVSKSFFNGFGRPVQTKNFDYQNQRTIVQNFTYNATGQLDSVCNPYDVSGSPDYGYSTPSWSNITTTKYDGIKIITKYPSGDSNYIIHYANTDTTWDGKGNKTVMKYNTFGGVDTVIDAKGNKTKYLYDKLGLMTKCIDAESKQTYYYYDTLGRLRGVNNPDANSNWEYHDLAVDVYYEYDDAGNITTKKDGQGITNYMYDEINRLTDIDFYDGQTTIDKARYTYDVAFSPPSPDTVYNNPKGRLSKVVTCGIDSTLFYYSDHGNLSRKNVTINGLGLKYFIYKYNNAGLCTLFYGGNADTVRYHYNKFGQLKEIPNIIDNIKYNPAGGMVKINYHNTIIDTLAYDNLFRTKKIKTILPGGGGDVYLNLNYAYEKNGNVDSIIDSVNTTWSQNFAYDSLNRLITVNCSEGNQSFTYDKVGNRLTKGNSSYTYVSNTNRLDNVDVGWVYRYDDCGNVIRRSNWYGTVDTFIYNWHNRMTQFARSTDNVEFTYDISGLRVKKHYYTTGGGGGGESGSMGIGFGDPIEDMGLKSKDSDSVYNKGRDIRKVWFKNTANNYEITIVNKNLFNVQNKMKMFITLDIDTIPNSGRLTLPEDTLTKVSKKAAWEYCLYIADNEYGYYTQDGIKHSMPMGLAANKVFGDSGKIVLTISKQVFNNIPAIRYTISTFAPGLTNSNPVFQGGSSAIDVWPGSKKTFGGGINGYGQFTPNSVTLSGEYTIFYLYNGIDPIAEYTADGSILARYIYANGRHVAEINGEDTSWYHCDALGSTRKMTNRMGANIWYAIYYPYGEMTGDGGNEHSFTGKEWDTEMGLNYFCQRYYDPNIGRFMELDAWTNLPDDTRLFSFEKYISRNNHYINYQPQAFKKAVLATTDIQLKQLNNAIIPVSFTTSDYLEKNVGRYINVYNGYLYCGNNPLRYIDPTGCFWDEFHNAAKAFMAAVGGLAGGVIGEYLGGPPGLVAGAIGLGVFSDYMYERYWDFLMEYGPIWEWDENTWNEFKGQ